MFELLENILRLENTEKYKTGYIIRHLINQHTRLQFYQEKNSGLPIFNNITPQLMKEYQKEAKAHIIHLLSCAKNQPTLYKLIETYHYNYINIDYKNVLLLKDTDAVINQFKTIAKTFMKPTDENNSLNLKLHVCI